LREPVPTSLENALGLNQKKAGAKRRLFRFGLLLFQRHTRQPLLADGGYSGLRKLLVKNLRLSFPE